VKRVRMLRMKKSSRGTYITTISRCVSNGDSRFSSPWGSGLFCSVGIRGNINIKGPLQDEHTRVSKFEVLAD